EEPAHRAPPTRVTSSRIRSCNSHWTVKRFPPVPAGVEETAPIVIWITRAPTGALGAMAIWRSTSVPSGLTEKVTTVMLESGALFRRKLTPVAPPRPAPSARTDRLGVPGAPGARDTPVITGWSETETVAAVISGLTGPTWTLTVPGTLLSATSGGSANRTLTLPATDGVSGWPTWTLTGRPVR